MSKYYLIKQVITNKIKSTIEIGCPANHKHLRQFVNCVSTVGNVFVYLIDKDNGTKEDLTNDLGFTGFDLKKYSKNQLEYLKYYFKNDDKVDIKNESLFNKVCIRYYRLDGFYCYVSSDAFLSYLPKNLFIYGVVFHFKGSDFSFPNYSSYNKLFLKKQTKKDKHNLFIGNEYEKFIGRKYENENFTVDYRGISKGKLDLGIDLICSKDNKIVLVQCKNWLSTDFNKIASKDLRAFLGDCYLYLLSNPHIKNVSFHFIYSADDILDEGAKMFLRYNKIIKAKYIIFDD
jgi:hypothetical protein